MTKRVTVAIRVKDEFNGFEGDVTVAEFEGEADPDDIAITLSYEFPQLEERAR